MNAQCKGVIVATFKCTAQCRECCFECSPNIEERLSLEDIKAFIDEICKFKNIQILVWSGGECFLLGEDLRKGIEYANRKGVSSRCVTNGYWATTLEKAKDELRILKHLGLKELNLSTGDDHQEFVPLENILNAIVAGAQLHIVTVVAIETSATAKFKADDLKMHPFFIEQIEKKKLSKYVKIMNAVWVSFHSDRIFEYDEDSKEYRNSQGCNTLFDSICIAPDKTILGCCGLCVEHIPELALGKFDGKNLGEKYEEQKEDFIKIWLAVEGPHAIIDQVKRWCPLIEIPKFHHMCQACAYIYQSKDIQKVIVEHYYEMYEEIRDRFAAKQLLENIN